VALPPEPPEEQPPPPPPAADAEGGECPRCGTPYEPLQEYCLECGLRLPVNRGIIPVLSTAWRKRVPWYPGDWVWPVVGLLIVAALAATIAILANNDESATKALVATSESIPAGTGTGGESPPPPPVGTATSPEPTTTLPTTQEPPPPPPANQLIEWPAGQNGWTIVLASIPQSSGRATAQRTARTALNDGLTDVGVLDSSEFSSLHPGFYVVFSGVYNSESEARSAVGTAKSSFPQAYVRQITQ
jgi:hypothetical protein